MRPAAVASGKVAFGSPRRAVRTGFARTAFASAAVLLLAWPARASLQEELPDVVLGSPEIQAKAAELGHDPVRIYEFVRNEVEYQVYYGLMKGPEGTLRSLAGNEYDQAALLVSLLRASNVPARFVRGRIRISGSAANAWIGTTSPAAARFIWTFTHPPAWAPPPAWTSIPGVGATWDAGANLLEKIHVWVEAEVPLARYRGSGTDPRGKAWIPLDPSYKESDWQADPGLLSGSSPAVTFDYTGAGGYYQSVDSRLPVEVFEDQVRSYLAQNDPGSPLEEQLFIGRIREERPGVLPTSLPYELSTGLPPIRAASLVDLHSPQPGWPAVTGQNGAWDYRYRWSLHLCLGSNVTSCGDGASPFLSHEDASAALDARRVTFSFPPTSATASLVPDDGYRCPDVLSIWVVPTLWIDGTAAATAAAIPLCSAITMRATTKSPLGAVKSPFVESVHPGHLAAGTFVFGLDAHASGPVLTQRVAERLLSLYETYSLGEAGGLAFVDENDDGLKNPGERFLGQHFAAQEALVGGLLHLGITNYYALLRSGSRRLYELHHRVAFHFPSVGMALSSFTPSMLFDAPFSARAASVVIDIKGEFQTALSRSQGIYTTADGPIAQLFGHHASAAEHTTWEEIAAVEAISTMKAFQISYSKGRSLLVVNSQAGADAATQSCDGTVCTEIDPRTYCEIKKGWATSTPYWRASAWDGACLYRHDQVSGVTLLELRIPNKGVFDYSGWNGYALYAIFAGPEGQFDLYGVATDDQEVMGAAFVVPQSPVPLLDLSLSQTFLSMDVFTFTGNSLQANTVTAGDPVSVVTGNNQHVETDLSIRGRGGFDLTLVRSYNSRLDYAGPLGFGWTHTFDQHLRVEEGDPGDPSDDVVVWLDERGTETKWKDVASPLEPDRGVHHTLLREADGSYRLTTKWGMVYRFAAEAQGRARLLSIRDRNGNQITCGYDGALRLAALTDTAGRLLTLRYDASGHLEEIEDWTGRKWKYVVDASGDLVEYRDPVQVARGANGRPTVYTYYGGLPEPALNHNLETWTLPADRDDPGSDGDVRMRWVYYANDTTYKHTNSLGETTFFAYNFFRKRTSVTHPDGSTEQYVFDAFGNVVRHEDGRGVVRQYEYDEDTRNRTREVDGLGFETLATAYDSQGNLTERRDRLGKVESWTYDSFSQPLTHTDREGHLRTWEYDAQGNLRFERAVVDGVLTLLREHTYDGYGNRESSREYREPGGPARTTNFGIHPLGVGVERVTDPQNHVTTFVLDDLSRVESASATRTVPGETEPRTVTVELDYDFLDRVTAVTDPVGTIRETVYDDNGNVEERRTVVPRPAPQVPLVRVDARLEYDAADRLVASSNALEVAATPANEGTTQLGYDARGRLVRSVSPLGNVTEREYDAAGNLVRMLDGAGAAWTWVYDAEGRLTRAIDPLGRESKTRYDAEGRVIEQRGPNDRLVFEVPDPGVDGLDAEGRPERIRDGRGTETRIVYDELGRRRSVTAAFGLPEEGTTVLGYDLQDRLVSKRDPELRTTTLVYDDAGRLEIVRDPLLRETHYGYDEIGSLVSSTDGAGETLTYERDDRGLLLELTGPGVADRFRYDAFGRRTLAENALGAFLFEYDALDRAVTVSDPNFGTERRSYDADGRLVQRVYPDHPTNGFAEGAVLTYQYDARGLLSGITDPLAGSFHFEYDAAGRPVRTRFPYGGERRSFYTAEGFLDFTQTSLQGGGAEQQDFTAHDALGNPGAQATGEGTTQFAYDALGRLEAVAYPSNAGSETFGYDRAGNRTVHVPRNRASRTYTVDAGSQLTEIRDTATSALLESFGHDGAGRRTAHTAAGVTTTFAYDALGRLRSVTRPGATSYSLVLEYDALGRRRTSVENGGSPLQFGDLIERRGSTKYRLLPGASLDETLAEFQGATVVAATPRLLFGDQLGSVTFVTSSTAPAMVRRYEAFGALRLKQNSAPVDRAYVGRPYEGQSGLIYLRARHYDPATGRFLQPDPLGVDADQPYAYAANNPIVFRDPLGLSPVSLHTYMPSVSAAGAPTLRGVGRANYEQRGLWGIARTPSDYFAQFSEYAFAAGNAYSESGTFSGALAASQYYQVGASATLVSGFLDPVNLALTAVTGVGSLGARSPQAVATGTGTGLARVGRWMGHAEYDAMLETRAVQVGGGNTTYVANPANIQSYLPRARPGDLYVEFDVPSPWLRPAGRPDWSQVPGPGHRLDLLDPIPRPVPATDIEHLATRIGK
jgi:RHS repeat-associated protein